jgi:hypothetical protein
MHRAAPDGPPISIPSLLISQSSGVKLHAVIDGNSNPYGPVVFMDGLDPYVKVRGPARHFCY